MQEIVNVISYKVMVIIMQKRGSLEYSSGVGKKLFEFMPSIRLENTLLASTTNIAFIIDLVLFGL